jgi:mannosyltransferase
VIRSVSAAPAEQRPASGRPERLVIAVALGVLTAVLGLVNSWYVSLWTDEAATISGSGRSLGELWRMTDTIDVVHAAYYAGMHLWTSVFGISPVALRLPSALAMGVAAAGVSVLGARLGGTRLAVAAGLVFAILPRVTWLGIEARPYALATALAVWATVVLLAALDRRSTGLWVAYALLVGAGIAVNIYGGLLLVAHAVSLLLTRRRTWRQCTPWLVAGIAGAVLASPVVLRAVGQTGQLGGEDFRISQLVRNVGVNQWFLGGTPTTTGGVDTTVVSLTDPASLWKYAAVGVALVAWTLIAVAVVAAFRRRSDAAARNALSWLLPWIVVPTAVIGLYSVVVSPMYSARYLSFASPAVALLIGMGILALRSRAAKITAGVLLVALTVPVYLSQRTLWAKSSSDWVSVAEYVQTHATPGDGVYFSPRYPVDGDLVRQTTRGIATAYPDAFARLDDLTLVQTAVQAGNLTGFSRTLAASTAALAGEDTVWVLRRHDYDPADEATDDATLAAAGFTGTLEWSGTLDRVYRFSRSG